MRDFVIPLLVAFALFGMRSEIKSLQQQVQACAEQTKELP